MKTVRRRHPAPVGGRLRLRRGPAHRPEILKQQAEAYRRLRNTLRYLLGSLDGFSDGRAAGPCRDAGAGALGAAPPGRARRAACASAVDDYDFHAVVYRSSTISAPSICRPSTSTSARTRSTATRPTARAAAPRARCWTSSSRCLTAWLAPVLCFTAEEAWLARPATCRTARPRACICASSRRSRRPGAMPALGERWKTRARAAPRRHRRAGARARREAHRLQPAGRARTSMPAPEYHRGAGGPRPGRDLHHLRRRPGRRATAPAGAFTLADVAGVAVVPGLADGRRSARAAGRCWRRSASRPPIRCSAGAARRR